MAKPTTEETLFHWLAGIHKELKLMNYYLAYIRGLGTEESDQPDIERYQAAPRAGIAEGSELQQLRDIIHQQLKEVLDIPSEED